MDNSLYRTASWVPMVSSIERLHYAYRIDGNSCSDIRIVRASEDNPVITVHHCAIGACWPLVWWEYTAGMDCVTLHAWMFPHPGSGG